METSYLIDYVVTTTDNTISPRGQLEVADYKDAVSSLYGFYGKDLIDIVSINILKKFNGRED